MKKIFLIILASIFIFSFFSFSAKASQPSQSRVDIYYSQYCSGCGDYVKELKGFFESAHYSINIQDYVADKSVREELKNKIEKVGIPAELQGHLMIFISQQTGQEPIVILGGHVPLGEIKHLLDNRDKFNDYGFNKIYALQDEMHNPKSYKAWAFKGPIKEYSIGTPISEYLNWFKENKDSFKKEFNLGKKALLPTVLVTGFLDGINPCAIAVLIFFIAFLFSLKEKLRKIFGLGLLYIFVIFLTYLGIGLGLFKAIVISGEPHFMAKLGAWLVIGLGVIQLKDYWWPRLPFHLKIPHFSQGTIKYWLEKTTLPAVIVGAFLVGLCTFPCSGGIYVAIVGLLASQKTFWQGLGYLIIYNIMFVVPLLALLFAVGNRKVLGRLAEFQSKSEIQMKLFMGASMIALGVIILLFFV